MRIAFINHKGGVGKTTCSINLAHAVGNKGKTVLIVEQDPQCNASATLLAGESVEGPTLYDLYLGTETVTGKDCVYPTPYENVFIMPNQHETSSLELPLYQAIPQSYLITKKAVDEVKDDYDYVFFDCPPSLGLWTLQALIASNFVIVPVTTGNGYAISGLMRAIEAIEDVGRTVNPELKFLRLLLNCVDLRTVVTKATIELLKKRFGDKIFKTGIPQSTHIDQAILYNLTVIRHNPQSISSKKFRELADELIELTEKIRMEL